MRLTILFLLLLIGIVQSWSQHEPQTYIPDPDPLVQQKLEQWQNLKFGLLMHWGTYSQWGIVESWSICPEDYGWCERKKGNSPENYFEYVKEYENLKSTFNPTRFDPERWAKAAANAGMKYVIFTTKHHDGYCMFDTKYTDYKITDVGCPFHSNPKANVTKEIFDAVRAEGMWVGPYFSKPDWHNNDYWYPYFSPMDRNVNYDPAVYPEKWENFVQFTQNQIMELMTDYGPVDILWLDGGWVRKHTKEEIDNYYRDTSNYSASGFMKTKLINQDIHMDELVKKAREKQPGLIVVDRAVPGKNQNYLTPENRVPEEALPYPWESCIIAGGSWSWVPDATYMSGREAIHLLVDIVAKGGNLLLNIAPGPEGQWHEEAYKMLEEIGGWMKVNSEAIYDTRAFYPFKEGRVCYTKSKAESIYAIYLVEENEDVFSEELALPGLHDESIKNIEILGFGAKINWKVTDENLVIQIPLALRKKLVENYAVTFKISLNE
ncbi:MAG: alpha-L-fucosidase [Bacteroidales bacterium]|nr:alpha-L-fucosidase [Bacteroidales bacterium]